MNRAWWPFALSSLAGGATGVVGAFATAEANAPVGIGVMAYDEEGGHTPVRVELVPTRLVRNDGREQLVLEAQVQQSVSDEASLGGLFEVLGSHGESLHKSFAPVARVARGAHKTFELATPGDLRDGFYQVRFTASAATAKRSGQQQAYEYLHVHGGRIDLLTSDEFYKVSDANLSIESEVAR